MNRELKEELRASRSQLQEAEATKKNTCMSQFLDGYCRSAYTDYTITHYNMIINIYA